MRAESPDRTTSTAADSAFAHPWASNPIAWTTAAERSIHDQPRAEARPAAGPLQGFGRAHRIVPLPFPEQGVKVDPERIYHSDGRTEPYSDQRWAALTREYLLSLGNMSDDISPPVWDERPHWAYVRYQCMRCLFIWQNSDEIMGGGMVPVDEDGIIVCPFCEPWRVVEIPRKPFSW